mgnify:CR=1 FL=1
MQSGKHKGLGLTPSRPAAELGGSAGRASNNNATKALFSDPTLPLRRALPLPYPLWTQRNGMTNRYGIRKLRGDFLCIPEAGKAGGGLTCAKAQQREASEAGRCAAGPHSLLLLLRLLLLLLRRRLAAGCPVAETAQLAATRLGKPGERGFAPPVVFTW